MDALKTQVVRPADVKAMVIALDGWFLDGSGTHEATLNDLYDGPDMENGGGQLADAEYCYAASLQAAQKLKLTIGPVTKVLADRVIRTPPLLALRCAVAASEAGVLSAQKRLESEKAALFAARAKLVALEARHEAKRCAQVDRVNDQLEKKGKVLFVKGDQVRIHAEADGRTLERFDNFNDGLKRARQLARATH